MKDQDLERLYNDLSEKIEELDVMFHDHGIEFSCEEDCHEGLDEDIVRVLDLLKEAKLIVDENI